MKILGYDYNLVYGNHEELLGVCGIHHATIQKIFIASYLCEQQKISTVLHEIIEALNYHLDLNIEHRSIMSLEAALMQVLTDSGVDLSPITKEILTPTEKEQVG